MLPLSIVTLGHVHAEDLEPLTHSFTRIEQLVLDINPRDPLAKHRPEFHRAVDAATADWVLIVREREKTSRELGEEIARVIEVPPARAFRIGTVVLYAGAPLQMGRESELRLLDKRRLERSAEGELRVDGGELQLAQSFTAASFESARAHRDYLAGSGAKRRPAVGRILRFLLDVVAVRTLDRNTLRYIWIEAGFVRF